MQKEGSVAVGLDKSDREDVVGVWWVKGEGGQEKARDRLEQDSEGWWGGGYIAVD
jgi:hypothetical protein